MWFAAGHFLTEKNGETVGMRLNIALNVAGEIDERSSFNFSKSTSRKK